MDDVLCRQPIAAGDFGACRFRSRPASGIRPANPDRRRDGWRHRRRRRRATTRLAAFTIASSASVVMSATQTSSRAEPTSAETSGAFRHADDNAAAMSRPFGARFGARSTVLFTPISSKCSSRNRRAARLPLTCSISKEIVVGRQLAGGIEIGAERSNRMR